MNGKRLLLVGGSGLIGRELSEPLAQSGFEVFAVARHASGSMPWIWREGDIFDASFIRNVMHDVRPTHLLNLAWCTTDDYLTNSINLDYLEAGLNLTREFIAVGGQRVVCAGTCFEYALDGSSQPIHETDALDVEKNLYTHCKNELRTRTQEICASAGISFAFGRIFYVYGRNEAAGRLTGMVVNNLNRDVPVTIKSGPLFKDYIYSRDVAGAFAAITNSRVEGVVNVCTGRMISIRDYVMKLAVRLGRPDLIVFEDDCARQPACIVGDNSRLRKEVGYAMRWDVDQAIDEVVKAAKVRLMPAAVS